MNLLVKWLTVTVLSFLKEWWYKFKKSGLQQKLDAAHAASEQSSQEAADAKEISDEAQGSSGDAVDDFRIKLKQYRKGGDGLQQLVDSMQRGGGAAAADDKQAGGDDRQAEKGNLKSKNGDKNTH